MQIRAAAPFWVFILLLPSVATAQIGAGSPLGNAPAVPAGGGIQTNHAPPASESTPADPNPVGSGVQADGADPSPAPAPPEAAPPPSAPFNEPPKPERAPAAVAPPPDDGPPTLLTKRAPKLGGYGGVSVLGSRTMGKNVVFVGGEAALLLDHRLAIGLAGYGLASRVAGPADIFGDPQRLAFGYGGLLLRYSLLFTQPYYLTIGVLVGAGGAAYTPEWNRNWSDRRDVHADPLLVVEPSVGGHLNITRWMRLGLQVSYRFVSGVDAAPADGLPSDEDLAGFAYGGHLQFGWL